MQQTAANLVEYSVSEISAAVKRAIEDGFNYVRVRGEISGFRGVHTSGHAYFALKDDRARLEAVIWKTTLQRIRFKPQEGLEVVATGRLTTFPGSSKYQIVIDALEPAGVGALMALLEERRKKLAAEGLFEEGRKKKLPYLPRVIGVVTSPTGAVIRDILHRLADRFPAAVLVWPVKVQGETAAAEVANAIRGFNALRPGGPIPRPDLLIVARGGGSLEDLWGFNEEIVVRAAAASAIPLISAIGHETDLTLLDHVADRRAPTPTAAAEIAVPVRAELMAAVAELGARHYGATLRLIEGNKRELRSASRGLPRAEELFAVPRRMFDELASRLGRGLIANERAHRAAYERTAARLSLRGLARLGERGRERLEAVANRQIRAMGVRLDRARARLGSAAQLLEALSYRNILARGFAIVRDAGVPVRSASGVIPGSPLDIEFIDGHVTVTASRGPRKKTGGGEQESLF
ncbi:MAG TPA: exodeoxyribonuclease VII large subunit [Bauldia sp.]|nr:exodeoxyribonuclease VII large subunit [Bauldia sp.]